MSDEFTAGGCNPSDCASCGGGCSSAGGCDPVENHKTITLTMESSTDIWRSNSLTSDRKSVV